MRGVRSCSSAAGGLPNTFVPGRNLPVELSHSCHLGDRSRRRAWGYGCGACPACDLRRKGWESHVAATRAGGHERR
ncbi:MAG: 7-cyano-7-deazaguanine synthase [Ideonella sp.]|nr:7-cyano-7-deazaguanine synthase [Ideonella sp.]